MEFYSIQIGLALMLAFVTFLLSNRINNSANRYLAILFGFISLLFTLPLIGEYFFEEWSGVDIIIESIKFLIPSFLYLSVYHFVNRPNYFLKKHYLLFIPFIMVVMVWLFLNSTETNRLFLENSYEILDAFLIITLFLFSVIIFYFVIKMLIKHKKNVLKLHSNKQGVNLNWLYNLILVFPLLLIIHLVFELSSEENYFVYFSNFMLFIILFYSGYHILQQREVFDLTTRQKLQFVNEPLQKVSFQKEELIDKNLVLEIANELEKLMEEEQPFLNKNLSLSILSDKLNTRTHILSFVINTNYNVNFYTYVNKFRLDYSKSLLKNPKKQHLSMEGVAYESGFGSKSTFNTLFKKQIGMTPIQYKNSKNQ
ncbi:helix-turn-helix domain-containing protein [uncultured Winogradskyella sp.]|uniref:helix-turn-helix domain-containing protein n=1 Tax=uncultured Winogradskyella sp. TaxID=395353 RepID=UPI0030EEA266|tara:strand:- start:3845 stop:4948 length:1104 start_codon:yes stop_codon:yes gene_type:complete